MYLYSGDINYGRRRSMIALSISSWQAGLLLAACISALNIYEDRQEATIYIHPVLGPIQLVTRGSYFCPSYCDVQHVHSAHLSDYSCGHLGCACMLYEKGVYPSQEKIKVKRKKTKN